MAGQVIYDLEEQMYQAELFSANNHALAKLYDALLDLGARPEVTQGVYFTMRWYHAGHLVTHFLETGSFVGFLHAHGHTLLPKTQGSHEMLAYRVYTAEDISRRQAYLQCRATSSGTKRQKSGEKT